MFTTAIKMARNMNDGDTEWECLEVNKGLCNFQQNREWQKII